MVLCLIMPLLIPEIEAVSSSGKSLDYKTKLQQFVQASSKDKIQYVVVKEEGPDHDKTFMVEVRINTNVVGVGTGKTKREAEQVAAKEALELFGVK